ncbi:phosphate acetyltransferase [candidate division KSB1 bacterium]
MDLVKKIIEKAKSLNKKVVFPEGYESRTIEAASRLASENIVEPILLGNKENISKSAETAGIDLNKVFIIDPRKYNRINDFADEFYEIRKHKGITREQALETVKDPLYFGGMMLRNGLCHGSVAGAENATGNVLRAAIQTVGLAEGISVVSSFFIMILPDGRLFSFADCAVVPDPDPEQLASIAISTAKNHKKLVGEEPIVAMLSFSTKGSAQHENVDKVLEALKMVKDKAPDLIIDGELQLDAAIMPAVGNKKAPGSPAAGKANVLIFPELNSANIGYKLTERLGNAEAIGPVIQGLAKPAFDLSRGCKVDDIVNVASIAAIMS